MLFPNKIVPYYESVLFWFPIVLEEVQKCAEGTSPAALYEKLHARLDISQFIDVLDCLFALGKLALDSEKGVLLYVV